MKGSLNPILFRILYTKKTWRKTAPNLQRCAMPVDVQGPIARQFAQTQSPHNFSGKTMIGLEHTILSCATRISPLDNVLG